MPRLIDTHCHVHFPAYDGNREDVLKRMHAQGVWGITVGTTTNTSEMAARFADSHEGIWAAVGYHPEHFTSAYHDAAEGDADQYSIDAIRTIAQSSKKVVAIGETGLDFFRVDDGRDVAQSHALQERGFRDHLALANELDLPIVIHCRQALNRLAEILREERAAGKSIRGVVHCFTGTWAEAEPLLELGLHVSFTGIITFPAKKIEDPEQSIHRVIERMPLDRLLIETDAPYLTPVPYRGKQNEPVFVECVAQKVAELRMVSLAEIATQSTENARELFRI